MNETDILLKNTKEELVQMLITERIRHSQYMQKQIEIHRETFTSLMEIASKMKQEGW